MELFSIIIPVFNTEQYISQCLESILSQSFSNFEVICVDDQSTDDSLKILNEFASRDERIKVVANSKGGVSKARNTALDVAKGKYVLFVDSDDWILPGTLELLSKEVDGFDLIAFPSSCYSESRGKIEEGTLCAGAVFPSGWDYYGVASNRINSFGLICGKVYSSTMLKSNGIRFSEGISYHEDILFAIEACSVAGPVKLITSSLYVYRIREQGSLMSTYCEKRFLDMARVANALSEKFLHREGLCQDTVRRTIASYYRNCFVWSERSSWPNLKALVDWESFREASEVSRKTCVAFYAFRFALSPTATILSARHRRRVANKSKNG